MTDEQLTDLVERIDELLEKLTGIAESMGISAKNWHRYGAAPSLYMELSYMVQADDVKAAWGDTAPDESPEVLRESLTAMLSEAMEHKAIFEAMLPDKVPKIMAAYFMSLAPHYLHRYSNSTRAALLWKIGILERSLYTMEGLLMGVGHMSPQRVMKEMGQKGAAVRHALNYEKRNAIIAAFKAGKFKSKDAAAEPLSKQFDVEWRTARDYLKGV